MWEHGWGRRSSETVAQDTVLWGWTPGTVARDTALWGWTLGTSGPGHSPLGLYSGDSGPGHSPLGLDTGDSGPGHSPLGLDSGDEWPGTQPSGAGLRRRVARDTALWGCTLGTVARDTALWGWTLGTVARDTALWGWTPGTSGPRHSPLGLDSGDEWPQTQSSGAALRGQWPGTQSSGAGPCVPLGDGPACPEGVAGGDGPGFGPGDPAGRPRAPSLGQDAGPAEACPPRARPPPRAAPARPRLSAARAQRPLLVRRRASERASPGLPSSALGPASSCAVSSGLFCDPVTSSCRTQFTVATVLPGGSLEPSVQAMMPTAWPIAVSTRLLLQVPKGPFPSPSFGLKSRSEPT